jgi:hypothetical protein
MTYSKRRKTFLKLSWGIRLTRTKMMEIWWGKFSNPSIVKEDNIFSGYLLSV